MLDKNFYSIKAEELEKMARAMRKMAELEGQEDLFEEGELDGGLDEQGYPCEMNKQERAVIEEKEYENRLGYGDTSNTVEEPVTLDDIRSILVEKKRL